MTKLYITDRLDLKFNKNDGDFVYFIGDAVCPYNDVENVANPKELNRIALNIRDDYSSYIYSLNKIFLKNDLVFNQDLSLFHISDLSNKRTELYDVFPCVCHVILIKNLIESLKIAEVVVCGCTDFFLNSVKSVCGDISLKIKRNKTIGCKTNVLFDFIAVLKFVLCSILKRCILYFNKLDVPLNDVDNLFLTFYPLHLNLNGFEKKYGKLVNKNDAYLVCMNTEGFLLRQNFFQYYKYATELAGLSKTRQIFLLDGFINFADFFEVFRTYFKLVKSYKKIFRETFIFKGIDITNYLLEEVNVSFLRIPRMTLYKKAISRLCAKVKIKNFIYYMHEYCWGRWLTYCFRRSSFSGKLIGFQHGPASYRKLLYCMAKGEADGGNHDYLNHVPIPDEVFAETEFAKKIYEHAGYTNVKVMEKIYRLYYLDGIERKRIESDKILVAGGLHDSFLLFDFLTDEFLKNPQRKYYIRFHPKLDHGLIEKKIHSCRSKNVFIADGELLSYLSTVSEVVTTYSSVGYEAYLLGIKVRLIDLPWKINESPLLDMIEQKEVP